VINAIKPTSPAGLDQVDPNANPNLVPLPPAVGAGMTGPTSGATPPVGGVTLDVGALLAGLLDRIAPQDANKDPSVAVAIALGRMLAVQGQSADQQVKANNAEQATVFALRIKQAEDAIKQLADVKDCSIWGKIKLGLEAALAIQIIYTGIGLQAAPTGATNALGGLMIAAGTLQLIDCADTFCKMETNHGLAGYTALHVFHCSEKAADDADMAFQITLAIAQIAVGIATCFAGDTQSVNSGYTQLAGALTKATGDTVVAVVSYQNATHQANSKQDKAMEAEFQATADLLDEYIQKSMKQLTETSKNWAQILSDATATVHARANALTQVRYA
jgi:hypothetical protein